jgi:hypothetical protein
MLVLIETVLALIDLTGGLIAGHSLLRELRFMFSRIGISIILRERVAAGASVDALRGLPVIHVNFLV